ncbi:hypothetical protein GCM10009119_26890 [Algoriphagus jejuensis]|uniref:Glycosyltransferase involved in cell wall biosynthesis n=1 Tax=Algoriphagus jejuensis TaxID=419934 RepID=A0ABP3YG33_9BACT
MKKILFITNMFPTEKHPLHGIFIKEQIEDLKKNHEFEHEIFLIQSVHRSKLEYFKSIFQIPKRIRKFKPDIIHVHYGISGFFLLFYRPSVKVFLTLHGSDFNNRGSNYLQVWFSKRIISKVDVVFVQNAGMKDNALRYNKNVEVLTCGVDTDFFNPGIFERESRIEKTILFPSSPSRSVKNYPLFLEAVKVLEDDYNHKIIIKNLENSSRAQVKNIIISSDCLLMTSITEGSPQVIKESLSCGLPVVSVPVGDVAEMTKDVPNCFIASSHNPKELAELVDKTFQNQNSGIRDAFLKKDQFSNHTITRRLADLYKVAFKNSK